MKVIKKIISIVITFCAIVGLFAITACIVFERTLSPEMIEKTITNYDINSLFTDITSEHQELYETVENTLEYIGLPKDAIPQILNSDGTKNFLSIYASNTVSALLNDSEEQSITKEDLKQLVSDNVDVIIQNMDMEEQQEIEAYVGQLETFIDDHESQIVRLFPSPKDILEKIDTNELTVGPLTFDQIQKLIQILTSKTLLMIVLGVEVVFLLLLILLNRKGYRWCSYFVFTFLLYALIMTVFQIFFLTIIKTELMNQLSNFESVINYVMNTLSKILWVEIIPAILLAIVFYILKRKKGVSKHEKVSHELS